MFEQWDHPTALGGSVAGALRSLGFEVSKYTGRAFEFLMHGSEWAVVAARLRRTFDGPTPEQRHLAEALSIDIDPQLPSMVAAAKLRERLSNVLDLSVECSDPTVGQIAYTRELADEVGIRLPAEPQTREERDGWVSALHALRTAASLEKLRPEPGDVVRVEGNLAEISSIDARGRLRFRGSGNYGAWPQSVEMVARPKDGNHYAEALAIAQRDRAARPIRGPVGVRELQELAGWRIDEVPTDADVIAFSAALETARDEQPLQAAVTRHPSLLACVVDGHQGTFVIPKQALGNEFVTDFLVAGLTSRGLVWRMVELESPRARISIKDGQASGQLRKGLQQIADWREWLHTNLLSARASKREHGLGLARIRADAVGLVLVSRGVPTVISDDLRQRVEREQRVAVRTYDWLIREATRHQYPGASRLTRELGELDSVRDLALDELLG